MSTEILAQHSDWEASQHVAGLISLRRVSKEARWRPFPTSTTRKDIP